MSHVRYPEDLFKVQRELLGRYHVTDASDFFKNTLAWSVPDDPTTTAKDKQPPYYLSLKMPGKDKTAFSLTTDFIPQEVADTDSRNILYGFMAANGDAGNVKGVKSPDYGKLQLLATAGRHAGARTRPGPEHLPVRSVRFGAVERAQAGPVGCHQRQPADPAHGRRHAVCAACLCEVHRFHLVPHPAAGSGGLRQQHWLRGHAQ